MRLLWRRSRLPPLRQQQPLHPAATKNAVVSASHLSFCKDYNAHRCALRGFGSSVPATVRGRSLPRRRSWSFPLHGRLSSFFFQSYPKMSGGGRVGGGVRADSDWNKTLHELGSLTSLPSCVTEIMITRHNKIKSHNGGLHHIHNSQHCETCRRKKRTGGGDVSFVVTSAGALWEVKPQF